MLSTVAAIILLAVAAIAAAAPMLAGRQRPQVLGRSPDPPAPPPEEIDYAAQARAIALALRQGFAPAPTAPRLQGWLSGLTDGERQELTAAAVAKGGYARVRKHLEGVELIAGVRAVAETRPRYAVAWVQDLADHTRYGSVPEAVRRTMIRPPRDTARDPLGYDVSNLAIAAARMEADEAAGKGEDELQAELRAVRSRFRVSAAGHRPPAPAP